MTTDRGGWDSMVRGMRYQKRLDNGSKVGIIGGGPSGSFFAYFLLRFARLMDMDLSVDIYEPRDFAKPGPAGCNMCGGIVSESLVQALAVEGINPRLFSEESTRTCYIQI